MSWLFLAKDRAYGHNPCNRFSHDQDARILCTEILHPLFFHSDRQRTRIQLPFLLPPIWEQITLLFIKKLSSKKPLLRRFLHRSCSFLLQIVLLFLLHIFPSLQETLSHLLPDQLLPELSHPLSIHLSLDFL